ncbi:MAG TPA: TIGR03936 family radical SAM-associated protein [Candidatus Limnocylindrales bacterium]|nr:TIGR03936 family radical SAM-associated protein [Candidatus Limnocylindrales bacterium]
MNPVLDGSKVLPAPIPVLPRDAVQRWRLVLARDAISPDGAGREQVSSWETALARCGLPVAGLDAAKPRPRFAPAAPLAAGVPGEAELIDVWLVERAPAWRVREAITAVLPSGWRLVDLYDVWLGEAALPGRVAASVYRATIAAGSVDAAAVREAASGLLAQPTLLRERQKGERTIAYDLRPFLDGIEVADGPEGAVVVTMTLRHDPEKGVGRPEELLASLGERAGTALAPSSLVRERLVLGDPPPPPPPAPRRRPPGARVGGQRP